MPKLIATAPKSSKNAFWCSSVLFPSTVVSDLSISKISRLFPSAKANQRVSTSKASRQMKALLHLWATGYVIGRFDMHYYWYMNLCFYSIAWASWPLRGLKGYFLQVRWAAQSFTRCFLEHSRCSLTTHPHHRASSGSLNFAQSGQKISISLLLSAIKNALCVLIVLPKRQVQQLQKQ